LEGPRRRKQAIYKAWQEGVTPAAPTSAETMALKAAEETVERMNSESMLALSLEKESDSTTP